MITETVDRVRIGITTLAGRIPVSLTGLERQKFIGEQIIARLGEEERSLLRSRFEGFLIEMRELAASDIDMGGNGARGSIWLRVYGIKKPQEEWGKFTVDEISILILNLLMDSQRHYLYENRNIDFSYSFHSSAGKILRHRANVYFDLDDLALNMRAINPTVRSFEGYGFHVNVQRVLHLANTKEGLILVTGITGSGKSTTLDSIIDMNNRTVDGHIIILASPVEFVHESQRCIVRHREVGRDTRSFKTGTIEALRQDPDIIVIGEMRDAETIEAALEVADSGHKVFSTLHTSSAIESIDRIIGEVPPGEQDRVRYRLADVLRCVISQKLIQSLDGKRGLAREIMLMTPAIRAAIKNNNTTEIYQMVSEGIKTGMFTMEQDLRELMLKKRITPEMAMNYANNKRMMQQLLRAA